MEEKEEIFCYALLLLDNISFPSKSLTAGKISSLTIYKNLQTRPLFISVAAIRLYLLKVLSQPITNSDGYFDIKATTCKLSDHSLHGNCPVNNSPPVFL